MAKVSRALPLMQRGGGEGKEERAEAEKLLTHHLSNFSLLHSVSVPAVSALKKLLFHCVFIVSHGAERRYVGLRAAVTGPALVQLLANLWAQVWPTTHLMFGLGSKKD